MCRREGELGKRGTGHENRVCVERGLVASAGDKRFVDAGEECGKKTASPSFFYLNNPISKNIYISRNTPSHQLPAYL